MEHKNFKSFNCGNEAEFMQYLVESLQNNKKVCMFEAYSDHTECWGESEEDWYMCCFLSENFTIHGILLALITVFGEDLNVEIDYDEENPIECEDGEVIYQKYLKVELA